MLDEKRIQEIPRCSWTEQCFLLEGHGGVHYTKPIFVQGWVAVTERLPYYAQLVLVAIVKPEARWTEPGVLTREGWKSLHHSPLNGVTLWQPLPAPPAAPKKSEDVNDQDK